jgi:hypothetical protein
LKRAVDIAMGGSILALMVLCFWACVKLGAIAGLVCGAR